MVEMALGQAPTVAARGNPGLPLAVCTQRPFPFQGGGLGTLRGLEPHSLDEVMILVLSGHVACELGVWSPELRRNLEGW